MAKESVQGPNGCIFQVDRGDGYQPVQCYKSFSFTADTQDKEITTKGNGVYKAFDYDQLSYSLSLDGVIRIPNDDQTNPVLFDFADYQKGFLPIKFRIVFKDGNNNIRAIRGTAIISNSTFNAQIPEVASGTISLKGTGEYFYDNTLDICDDTNIIDVTFTYIGTRSFINVEYTGSPVQIETEVDNSGDLVDTPATGSIQTIQIDDDLFVGVHQLMVRPYCSEIYKGAMYNTSFTVPMRYGGLYRVGTNSGTVCAVDPIQLYFNAEFHGTPGVSTMYTDATLETPATGYTFIVGGDGHIYNVNSGTGAIGTDTGLTCTVGTLYSVRLGTDTTSICTNSFTTIYINGAWSPGVTLYTDVNCTTNVTGSTYVLYPDFDASIYNLNTSTGQLGSDTDIICTVLGGLHIQKAVSGDHINVTVIDNVSHVTTSYDFNEAGGVKNFSDVFTSAHSYIVNVNVVPFGRPSSPIAISWHTGSNTSSSGTSCAATGVTTDNTGVIVTVYP